MIELREGRYALSSDGSLTPIASDPNGLTIWVSSDLSRRLRHTYAFVKKAQQAHEFGVRDEREFASGLRVRVEAHESGILALVSRTPEGVSLEPKLLRAALSQTNDVVLVTEGDPTEAQGAPRIVFVNEAFTRMTGYAAGEVLGKTPKILQGPNTDRETRRRLREQLDQWRPARAELLNYRKDGSEFWVEIDIAPVADQSGWFTHWIGIQRETTERRKREEETLVASQVKSLSVLAGGIAHDFNNALTSIVACSAIAERMLERLAMPEVAEAMAAIKDIDRAVTHAKSLTRQLLGLAKGGTTKPGPVDLRRLVEEIAPLALRGSNVKLDLKVEGESWIHADGGQIGQAIMNLLINARQAMPKGGTVWVSLTPPKHQPQSGDVVELRIRDEGTGIPKEHRARIFDPYFTTKPEGAGLGLAVVFSVVRKYGGAVSVESESGQVEHFTEFTIRFPTIARPPEPPGLLRSLSTAAGRVLLMDDEPGIRRSLTRLLGELGYQVESTADGPAALAAFQASREPGQAPFTALLLDLTIPSGPGGFEVARMVQALDPTVRIFVMSGYSEWLTPGNDVTIAGFLEKPFTVQTLMALLGGEHPQKRG